MLQVKEKFFDRFDQSFKILKKDFIKLFFPFFLYNFVSIVIVGTITKYYIFNSILNIESGNIINYFEILSNPIVIMFIIISSILFLGYLILFIPIFILLIKTIKQSSQEEEIDIVKNLKYGFQNILNIFKTYWYIFVYVALIPSILFIIGGVLLNIGFLVNDLSFLRIIGGLIIGISLIIFIAFATYRGIRTVFSLYSAIDNNIYTKENFQQSLETTNNNWWRILGNLFLVGLIVSIVIGIIGWIIGLFIFIGNHGLFGYNSLNLDIQNPEEVLKFIKNYLSNYSFSAEIISKTISTILETISSVFIFIFIYLFYIRLKFETKNTVKEIKNEL